MGRATVCEFVARGTTWRSWPAVEPLDGATWGRTLPLAVDVADDCRSCPATAAPAPCTRGNSAASQTHLDSFGDLMDAAWRYTTHDGYLAGARGDA